MGPLNRHVAVAAIALSLTGGELFASAQIRGGHAAGPGYSGMDTVCPSACFAVGPDPLGWSVYPSLDRLSACNQAIFYSFSLYDEVDNRDSHHRIYACTAYGHDWDNEVKAKAATVRSATEVDAMYQIGWNSSESGAETEYTSLMQQMREYVIHGHAPINKTTMLYAQFGHATAGLYIGQGLRGPDVANAALKPLEYDAAHFDGQRNSLAIQLCGPGSDPDHVLGFIATSDGNMGTIQSAFKSWSNAKCLEFLHSTNFTTSTPFTTPQMSSIKAKHALVKSNRTAGQNLTSKRSVSNLWLVSRASECQTEKVSDGDSCAALAERCGISGADFTKYNPDAALCSSLKPGQHVCCSSGELPDFRPLPDADGSCATTTVGDGETCAAIAAANSIEIEDLEEFNSHTWAWNGCGNIWAGSIICVSKGTPPMPAPMENAICGPQVPGTKEPTDMSKLAELNPCPLNACCDVWGQCGITPEFCTNTSTGAPGTAQPNTNGCISNCGTDIVQGSAPSEFRSVAYYEGYLFDRACLYQDSLQIDASKYTHLHFGFGSITSDYEIFIGDELITYEFNNFRFISGPKKILSFGGWDFSTKPETYNIFRQGTSPENRLKLATNIANFIKAHNLDGVDIDWEYPGAADIPDVPAGDKDEGQNYLAFLVILKDLLPGKSVSIAAPASYWYLKSFPIAEIGKVVDYIVFMTYDLHGQWDAGNPNAQSGCPSGNCLRSQVNLTETMTSLSMITKAGVPSDRVVVGVTSYGRSFSMAEAGCYGPQCQFTGSRSNSNAMKGRCTGTAGYLAEAEIYEIINASSAGLTTRDTPSSLADGVYYDEDSDSYFLVYNHTEWVSYMGPEIRDSRVKKYKGLNMGGSVNWATDLEKFLDAPNGNWSNFIDAVKRGENPLTNISASSGNWSSISCNDAHFKHYPFYTPAERWSGLNVQDAWSDLMNDWKRFRENGTDLPFAGYIAYLTGVTSSTDCGRIPAAGGCEATARCEDSSPAQSLIWNSLSAVSNMYSKYHLGLVSAAALLIDPSLDDFTKTFAPVPPEEDDMWINVLVELISQATPMVGGKFFKSAIERLPAFSSQTAEGKAKANTVTQSLLSGAVNIGTGLIGSPEADQWTSESQAEFTHFLGQSVYIWDKFNTRDLENLFNGSDESIERLGTLVADGHFITGASVKKNEEDHFDANETISDSFVRAYYGFAIPQIWQASGHHPFIIDTARDCDTKVDDEDLSTVCYGGKLYKLADPDGKSNSCSNCGGTGCYCPSDNPFSSLDGVKKMTNGNWGGVTVDDLIIGSVRTYMANGKENGGPIANPNKEFDSLVNGDITTPGYIRLPVCTEPAARLAWSNADKTSSVRGLSYFPCNPANGRDYCGDSTFVDQGSDGSPLISDCEQIIKDIESTDSSWNTFIEMQRDIRHSGTCHFGVTGKGRKGNSNFDVGGQDVIDIIRDAIRKFGRPDGRVGAKGIMQCNGNIKKQKVEWGLY